MPLPRTAQANGISQGAHTAGRAPGMQEALGQRRREIEEAALTPLRRPESTPGTGAPRLPIVRAALANTVSGTRSVRAVLKTQRCQLQDGVEKGQRRPEDG